MQEQTGDFQPFKELHSEQVQEIISSPPSWIIKWGILLLFFALVLMLTLTWIIKYPDVVNAKFTLMSKESPRALIVQSEGKLVKILVQDGEFVNKGANLAFSESTADHQQIIDLSDDIARIASLVKSGKWGNVKATNLLNYNKLGEVQTDFQVFAQQLLEIKSYLPGGYYSEKRRLLLRDVDDLRQLQTNLSQQLKLQQKDYALAKDEFAMQEKLYRSKVIAALELKKEEGKLLLREKHAIISSAEQIPANRC
jgi:HlyD family secretion protein